MLGGGCRQVGVLAAGCLFAYNRYLETNFLLQDHEKIFVLHEMLSKSTRVTAAMEWGLDPERCTNMLLLKFRWDACVNLKSLEASSGRHAVHVAFEEAMRARGVRVLNPTDTGGIVRLVMHRDVGNEDVVQLVAGLEDFCGNVVEGKCRLVAGA